MAAPVEKLPLANIKASEELCRLKEEEEEEEEEEEVGQIVSLGDSRIERVRGRLAILSS